MIIGYGGIGKEVGRLLGPFNAKISAICRSSHISSKGENGGNINEHKSDGAVRLLGWESFDEVAADVDFVVCCLPLTEETRGILNAKRFSAMKKVSGTVRT